MSDKFHRNSGQKLEVPFSFNGPRRRILALLWEEFVAAGDGLSPAQADRWLAARMRRERRFGQKDRRWYSEALFRCLRMGAAAVACEEAMAHLSSASSSGRQTSLPWHLWQDRSASGWWQGLVHLGLDRLVHWLSPDEIGGKERHVWDMVHIHETSLAGKLLAGGMSPSLAPQLQKRAELSGWSEAEVDLWRQTQADRAPLWLRLNDPAHRDDCERALRAAGFTEIIWDGPAAFRVVGTKGIYDTLPYEKGWIEIQDRASQWIGEALTLEPGAFVWDACAGGGGKTLQLAARLMGRGSVYVSDVRAYKLDEVKKRADRGGFTNIRQLSWDGKSVPEVPKVVSKRGGFDAILVDAPCSSSGTWRRNPDARFRLNENHVRELTEIQRAMIDHILPLLRPGGELLYATCSWFYEENEELVQHWLTRHATLRLVDMNMVGAPKDDSDTMFYARFVRS